MGSGFGTAGKGVREMAKDRYFKAWVIAAAFLFVAFLLFINLGKISRVGLPAVFLLVICIKIGGKYFEKKAYLLKKRAKQADRGAQAEEKVAVKLSELPEGYRYYNDIVFDSYNIDHVVVGAGGIYLIETKSHGGRVTANGDELLLNGAKPKRDFLNQAWRQTKDLEGFLYRMTSKTWKVKPVLCFTRAYVEVRRQVKGIEVVRLGYLNKFLQRQPEIMAPTEIDHIGNVLKNWMTRKQRTG